MLWGWVCLLQEVALPLAKEDRPRRGLREQRLEAGCLEQAAFSAERAEDDRDHKLLYFPVCVPG